MFNAEAGELDGVIDAVAALEADAGQKIRAILEYIGIQTVAYLRSLTDKVAPPIRRGDPPRRRHPGYWADRSGALAAAYAAPRVDSVGLGSWRLELSNSMEYAAALEARDGYFVLSGVADRGGPVEEALRKAVARIAPDWRVVYE